MIPALELPDSFKMSALQFPRRGAVPGRAGPAQAAAGPTEMSLPSISFAGAPLACKVKCPPRPDTDIAPALREVSGSWISLLYLNVGLISGLSILALPASGPYIGMLVCPVWSTAVVAHGFAGDNVSFAGGHLLSLLFPVVLLVRDFQLYAAYLLLFAVFASRGFWRDQRGVWLILCVLCWAGVLAGAGGLLVFELRPGILEAGALSGLGLAVVCTRRLSRFSYKFTSAGLQAQ
jgi:hypothetical protein